MRPTRVAAATAALLVLSATAAWAHPSFNPNAVPVGQAVETTLVVPHGCSTGDNVMPEEGEAVPTVRFDVQLVDGLTIEPHTINGWNAENDGEAIVWTADGGATTDPLEFPVTLTVEQGSPGDELHLAAYQECEDGSSYRWTEDSDSTPAILLELTEGETGTVDHHEDGDEHEAASETTTGTEGTSPEPTQEMTAMDDATSSETPTDQVTALDADAAAQEGEDPSNTGLVVAVIVLALLAIGGAAVAVRKRSA